MCTKTQPFTFATSIFLGGDGLVDGKGTLVAFVGVTFRLGGVLVFFGLALSVERRGWLLPIHRLNLLLFYPGIAATYIVPSEPVSQR